MHPENLEHHIRSCKAATNKPFGVNVPLLYPDIEQIMEIIMREQVPVVVTSAGSPKVWTAKLKATGCKVIHVVSSALFARKSQDAGVDAVVAEGFEAGGHNGREETTTLCLIPEVVDAVTIPVVAAGGIASGRAVAAALALGADGVQVGTRFALSEESSAHESFKAYCRESGEGGTMLSLKAVSPTRLLKNKFYQDVTAAEQRGASAEELRAILGRGRAKQGIFEGDLEEGELEIGQAASQIKHPETVAQIMDELVGGYQKALAALPAHL